MSNDVEHFIFHLYLELYNNSVPIGICDCVNECEGTNFMERVSYLLCGFFAFVCLLDWLRQKKEKYYILYEKHIFFIMSPILSY